MLAIAAAPGQSSDPTMPLMLSAVATFPPPSSVKATLSPSIGMAVKTIPATIPGPPAGI